MQYQEFLRKADLTEKDIPFKIYKNRIEPVYMESGLFPDQETFIDFFKKGGVFALGRDFLDRLEKAREMLAWARGYGLDQLFLEMLRK